MGIQSNYSSWLHHFDACTIDHANSFYNTSYPLTELRSAEQSADTLFRSNQRLMIIRMSSHSEQTVNPPLRFQISLKNHLYK